MPREKIRLPERYAAKLREQNERDRDAATATMYVMRTQQWSLQAIADVIGVTNQTIDGRIFNWKHAGRNTAEAIGKAIPMPHPHNLAVPPQLRSRHGPVVQPTPEKIARLRELQTVARQVRGHTPLDHPTRQASEQLTEEIAELYAQGVSLYQLAKLMDLTYKGLKDRLIRHGKLDAPSFKATRYGTKWERGRPLKDRCTWGHDLTDPDNVLILSNGTRQCRACGRRRSGEYGHRNVAAREAAAIAAFERRFLDGEVKRQEFRAMHMADPELHEKQCCKLHDWHVEPHVRCPQVKERK